MMFWSRIVSGFLKTFALKLRLSSQKVSTSSVKLPLSTFSALSDEELMMKYGRNQDPEAFDLLLSRYREQVFGFLFRSCSSREAAEDLYQETFMRVIRAAAAYKPSAKFRTWIFTIARNLLKDLYRRNLVRLPVFSLDFDNPEDNHAVREPADTRTPDPMQKAIDHETRIVLYQALRALPPEQREIFLLREEAGLDFQEAASVANCSVNTAKSRMRYALMKLRDELNQAGIRPERIIQP
jgi:RNA polymerase sigma-70 factor, ECF subfamily